MIYLGSIPARAGEPPVTNPARTYSRVYPRSRGGTKPTHRGSYSSRGRGYGSAYGHGAGYNQGGTAWYGVYGRPDLVYPTGGHSYGSSGSHGSRADWCRATYRSYNPYTGYYRAYSGRLIYCG